jgi:hypothetical protein
MIATLTRAHDSPILASVITDRKGPAVEPSFLAPLVHWLHLPFVGASGVSVVLACQLSGSQAVDVQRLKRSVSANPLNRINLLPPVTPCIHALNVMQSLGTLAAGVGKQNPIRPHLTLAAFND